MRLHTIAMKLAAVIATLLLLLSHSNRAFDTSAVRVPDILNLKITQTIFVFLQIKTPFT
jgi:hypothetical protein